MVNDYFWTTETSIYCRVHILQLKVCTAIIGVKTQMRISYPILIAKQRKKCVILRKET